MILKAEYLPNVGSFYVAMENGLVHSKKRKGASKAHVDPETGASYRKSNGKLVSISLLVPATSSWSAKKKQDVAKILESMEPTILRALLAQSQALVSVLKQASKP